MRIDAIERVTVLFDGREVGTLAMTADGVMAFEYARAWLDGGFSISPLSLPLERGVFVAKREPLGGAFGVFDDSLPDGWGKLLVDRTLQAHGIDPHAVGPLVRLSIVGASGMGALEYHPGTHVPIELGDLDFDDLADACAQMLKTDYADDLDTLFALGGSSGGARPKVLTTIDEEPWIIKFASSLDGADIGRDEYELAQIAKACGIVMPEVRLFPSKRCSGYFGVRRFDRVETPHGTARRHMVSAGALLETSHRIPNLDYELLMRLTMRLTQDMEDIERLYRLMCLNVFVGNRDDHAKNFSFLYDCERGAWELSPAYDITSNAGMYGEHATTVGGKGKDISIDDLIAAGVAAGLSGPRARRIAREIRAVVVDAGRPVCS